jgi:hypothetical protein
MKKLSALLTAALIAAACASSGPPVSPTLVTESEAAVRRAEAAGAGQMAPDLMAKARRAWDEGRAASSRGEGTVATRRFEEAREYARAAEMRATAEKTRGDAAALKQQADELEARTRQMRAAPTP